MTIALIGGGEVVPGGTSMNMNVTANDSGGSIFLSSVIGIFTHSSVFPGARVILPLVPLKSSPSAGRKGIK